MSGPGFVVLPISGDGGCYQNQDATESKSAGTHRLPVLETDTLSCFSVAQTIQESLHRKTHPEEYQEPEHHGPLKEIIGTIA
jgi:hypothetical protein